MIMSAWATYTVKIVLQKQNSDFFNFFLKRALDWARGQRAGAIAPPWVYLCTPLTTCLISLHLFMGLYHSLSVLHSLCDFLFSFFHYLFLCIPPSFHLYLCRSPSPSLSFSFYSQFIFLESLPSLSASYGELGCN